MRLHDAARRFHSTQAYDGYTAAPVFKCSFSSFDDHSSDGATVRRRVINLTPSDVLPARRVVQIEGDRWIVSAGAVDDFAGTPIRQHYGMKKATDLANLLTPAQACAAAVGTRAYVQKHYFKDVVNSLTDGKIDTFWNVFVAPGEPIAAGTFLNCGGVILRARNTYLPVEGLVVAQCDTLDAGAFQTITFVANGVYTPSTDSFTTISTAVPSYSLDFPKLYRFRTVADDKQEAGDLSVLVPTASITPKIGAEFTTASDRWRVLSVQPEMDCWLLHCRRA